MSMSNGRRAVAPAQNCVQVEEATRVVGSRDQADAYPPATLRFLREERLRPMALIVVEPFNHSDWGFELNRIARSRT
jgi:hypothetical protein